MKKRPKTYEHTPMFIAKKRKRLENALRQFNQQVERIHQRQLKKDRIKIDLAKAREQAVEDLETGHPIKDFDLLKWAIEAVKYHIEVYETYPESLPTGLTVSAYYRAKRCGFTVEQNGKVT